MVWIFWSGRPGSNRPPRPWQGRALPNELLPHIKELVHRMQTKRHTRFLQDGKDNNPMFPAKFLNGLIYTSEYTVCLQEPPLLAFPCNDACTSCNSHLIQRPAYKIPAGKTEIQKNLPIVCEIFFAVVFFLYLIHSLFNCSCKNNGSDRKNSVFLSTISVNVFLPFIKCAHTTLLCK